MRRFLLLSALISGCAVDVVDLTATDDITFSGETSDSGNKGADAPAPPDITDTNEISDFGNIEDPGDGGDEGLDPDDGGAPDDGPPVGECPAGMVCVTEFPFSHEGDTSVLPASVFDAYSCKPGADESGPEQVYRVTVAEAGFLSAAVYDGEGVDVDVHILSDLDPEACLDRGHRHARADVGPGQWYVVVDTFSTGVPQSGAYSVDIGFTVPSTGPCVMNTGIMKRVGDGGNHLPMPATGPIVKEAHLVTQEEPEPYPSTPTEELAEHYMLSQETTGFVMFRDQKWAPLEGGSFYGAGIGSPKLFPVVDEGWYVNMYWTKESRPERGTRMLLRIPETDRAVVVAAGYETGPGNLNHIGGTPEETHFYLATGHLDTMTIGIAADQSLPFGPRTCVDAPPGAEPTRYAADRLLSPITPSVVQQVAAIAGFDPLLADDVFMKVGASSTVSKHNLECMGAAGSDLAGYEVLQPTVDFFLGGDADGVSPWKRKTLAAKSGMSAGWAISGAPSPIEQEIGAIAPSIALVHYGANDMQLGTTYQSAIWGFGDNLLDLVDILIDVGVIPIVHGIGMRTDAPTAYRWIDSYNAVIRGVAQARQVPYVNLGLALEDLPGFGLAGDGLHLNTWIGPDGANACVFTPEALQQGFNMRNLQAVSALDVLRRTLHEEPPIEAPVVTQGAGGPDSPFVIDSLPFTDLRDTTMSAFSNLSAYSGCDADQDESGSEYLYVLELSEETRIRAMVFDRGAVDIDIHLLDETASEAGCLQRDHRIVQTTLPAGTYHFALDTFVNSGGTPLGGEFLFVVLRCEDDDPACDG